MNDRFNFNADDVRIKADDGRYLSGKEASDYLKKKKEELIVIREEIGVGEIVKLRDYDNEFKILSNNGEDFKYKGQLVDDEEPIVILFDQDDIVEVVNHR